MVSEASGERTSRVTENRINTVHFTRFHDRYLVFNKHREHALRAHSSAPLGSLSGGDQRPAETATECSHQGTGVCTAEDPASGRASAFAADRKVRAGQREAEQFTTGVAGTRARGQPGRGDCRERTGSSAACF